MKLSLLYTKYYTIIYLVKNKLFEARHIKSNILDDFNDDEEVITRVLDWNFIQESYDDDRFYHEFNDEKIPKDTDAKGDSEDFLRKGDICPAYDGSFNLDNCPKPPVCSDNFKEKHGEAKLCINRIPSPHQSIWYVATMKCIPIWENCKKCLCGTMHRSSSDGYCIFDGGDPDDDHVVVDCKNLNEVQIMGKIYTFSGNISFGIDEDYSYFGNNDHNSSIDDDNNDDE